MLMCACHVANWAIASRPCMLLNIKLMNEKLVVNHLAFNIIFCIALEVKGRATSNGH